MQINYFRLLLSLFSLASFPSISQQLLALASEASKHSPEPPVALHALQSQFGPFVEQELCVRNARHAVLDASVDARAPSHQRAVAPLQY